ncbi:MAG TPA: hypothetical protein VMF32_04195 [Xanthobacteraceae bacterium]|nr:hypothetical protein [Xanthobacteraceae bacterium]
MSRQTDVLTLSAIDPVAVQLPAINWASINQTAPQPAAPQPRQPDDPLPRADIVVITWTSAEWSALDHVFANSGSPRGNGVGAWDKDWQFYRRNTGSFTAGEHGDPLWGTFRVVTVAGATKQWNVILFHSDAHLQYQPYIDGLRAMVRTILTDVQPRYLYSIGTAGGATLAQALGDPVTTNCAQLLPGKQPNNTDPANGETFTCAGWYPPTAMFAPAQRLMFQLSDVVSAPELQNLFERLAQKTSIGPLTLNDLLNAPLQPENLGAPTVHSMPGVPLNTSCDFSMAPGSGSTNFAAYEEDDAVVGEVAQELHVNFAFIRNVSDPVVPDHTASGTIIAADIRRNWAGLLYDRYGLITASNGALATWAAIAAS